MTPPTRYGHSLFDLSLHLTKRYCNSSPTPARPFYPILDLICARQISRTWPASRGRHRSFAVEPTAKSNPDKQRVRPGRWLRFTGGMKQFRADFADRAGVATRRHSENATLTLE